MDINDVIDEWNKQADKFNQWDNLGSDEQVEFAIKCCQSPQKKQTEILSVNDLLSCMVDMIAIENPTPLKVVGLPQQTQVIQPFEHGHPYSKRTLLWLKNLPELKPTNIIAEYKPCLPSNTGGKKRGQEHSRGEERKGKERSKTFKGVAEAMAVQWAGKA